MKFFVPLAILSINLVAWAEDTHLNTNWSNEKTFYAPWPEASTYYGYICQGSGYWDSRLKAACVPVDDMNIPRYDNNPQKWGCATFHGDPDYCRTYWKEGRCFLREDGSCT